MDSGNYSCVPTVAESASVTVHVINGKLYPTLLIDNWCLLIHIDDFVSFSLVWFNTVNPQIKQMGRKWITSSVDLMINDRLSSKMQFEFE